MVKLGFHLCHSELGTILALLPVFVEAAATDILIHAWDFGDRGDLIECNPNFQTGCPLGSFVIQHDRSASDESAPLELNQLGRLNDGSALRCRVDNQNLTLKSPCAKSNCYPER